MDSTITRRLAALACAALACASLAVASSAQAAGSFIGSFTPNPPDLATTVPANGDINPYGIVVVPRSIGAERRGELLVSNFNASSNLQGTGTTIVQVPAGGSSGAPGSASVFAQIGGAATATCPGGIGLTTALSVLGNGDVVVGSTATSDGMADTIGAGCLVVIDPNGRVLRTISGGSIDGPWDMTALSVGPVSDLFVTNVLSGTVTRLTLAGADPYRAPCVIDEDVIATGFPHRSDPAALEIGPTGDALAANGTLYVSDSLEDRIAAVPDAILRERPATGGGTTVSTGTALNDPLGMALAPNGDILTVNGNDGNMVETTRAGATAAIVAADSAGGAGVLFGLAVAPEGNGVFFVDDGDNSVRLLH